MKKNLRNSFFGLLLLFSTSAHSQDWKWLSGAVSGNQTSMLGADFDDQGNTYTCGVYTTYIQYDTTTLKGSGQANYLAKHNAAGKVVAMKNISSILNKLKADHAGNLYIGAEYNSSSSPFVGNDTLRDKTDPTSFLLVTKLNSDLKPVWAVHYKNIGNSAIGTMDMFTDASNNIYMILKGNNILNIKGVDYSVIGTNGILKLNSDGDVVYFKVLPFALINMFGAGDKDGNAYITGTLTGSTKTITLDAASATNTNPAFNSSSYDPFIIKLNSAGVAQWVKLTNNALVNPINTQAGPNGISLDTKGNIYMYGDFNSMVVFGNDTLKGIAKDQYSTNAFIASYSNSGTKKWAYTTAKLTKTGPQFLQVRVSKKDLIYIYSGGLYGSYINKQFFHKITSISGSSDRVISCFDTNMVCKWYRLLSSGETNNQKGNIGVSLKEDVYVASGASTSFNGVSLGLVDTVSSPGSGIFIPKLTTNGVGSYFAYVAKYAADTSSIPSGIIALEKEEFKIYPNPATNFINIEHPKETAMIIEVYSMTGSLIKSVYTESGKTQISVEGISQGLYFVKMSNKNFVKTQKFVVN